MHGDQFLEYCVWIWSLIEGLRDQKRETKLAEALRIVHYIERMENIKVELNFFIPASRMFHSFVYIGHIKINPLTKLIWSR